MKPLWVIEWYDDHIEMNLARSIPKAEMVRMLRAIADGLTDGTLERHPDEARFFGERGSAQPS